MLFILWQCREQTIWRSSIIKQCQTDKHLSDWHWVNSAAALLSYSAKMSRSGPRRPVCLLIVALIAATAGKNAFDRTPLELHFADICKAFRHIGRRQPPAACKRFCADFGQAFRLLHGSENDAAIRHRLARITLVQLSKASAPMLTTPAGITTDSKLQHPSKAL